MTPAERQRLRRRRVKEDLVPVAIDLTRDQIDLLVDGGFLAQWDDHDKMAIAKALRRYLERSQVVTITA